MRTRYIAKLPELSTKNLIRLYAIGIREVDNNLGGDYGTSLSLNQIHFIAKLLSERGIDVDKLWEKISDIQEPDWDKIEDAET